MHNPKLTELASLCRVINLSFKVTMHPDRTVVFIPVGKDVRAMLDNTQWDWGLGRGMEGLGYYIRLESLT